MTRAAQIRLHFLVAPLTAVGLVSPVFAADRKPTATLLPVASNPTPGTVVEVLLAGPLLEPGRRVRLHAPANGDLWLALPDCKTSQRVRDFNIDRPQPFLLCLSSTTAQSIRAVASVSSDQAIAQLIESAPVAFSSSHLYDSPGLLAAVNLLLGAVFGVLSSIFTQSAETRRKQKQERLAARREEQKFLIDLLLPELAEHAEVLAENSKATSKDASALQALPRPNLVELIDPARAKRLETYVSSLGNADFVRSTRQYATDAGQYNDLVERSKRDATRLPDLLRLGEKLATQLSDMGLMP